MIELRHRSIHYHCFPQSCARVRDRVRRTPYSVGQEERVGLKYLEMILEFGLLLNTEHLEIPLTQFPTAPGMDNDASSVDRLTHRIDQPRACFTLASIADLMRQRPVAGAPMSHLDLFGRFAIGLDPMKARQLGLLPVHYFYRSGGLVAEQELASLSALTANYLLQVREILTFLAWSERERKTRIEGVLGSDALESHYERCGIVPRLAQPTYRDRILESIRTAEAHELDYVRKLLSFDHFHIGLLADSVNLLLATHQTVDSRTFGEELLYYFQQEWRIIATQLSDAILFDIRADASDPSIATLIADFCARTKEIAVANDLQAPNFDGALLLHGFGQPAAPLRDAIAVVLCPSRCEADVRRLLGRYDMPNASLVTL